MKELTKGRLIELFDEWTAMARRDYKWGDKDFYEVLLHSGRRLELHSCNKHLLTEADYKVKLGGFLNARLYDDGFTVHSELNDIYNRTPLRSIPRPDLTIHRIGDQNDVFCSMTAIRESVGAILEVKGASFLNPTYDLDMGHVREDVEKLATCLHEEVPLSAIRCLIILDEACQLGMQDFTGLERDIRLGEVLVLSNNDALSGLRNLA
jgi:hypothetical protein